VIRVLIADDHPIVRKGLEMVLSEQPDFTVQGVGTLPELRAYLVRQAPDVLVLDVNMPSGSSLEMIGEIKHLHSNLPILVLSIHPEEQAGVKAIIAGAQGYLTKESAPDQLVNAIRIIRSGKKFISPELAEALANHLQRPAGNKDPHDALSERELTVLKMIAGGKSTGDIATLLNLSPKTVSTYRSRILEKLKMGSNAELTRYVMEYGLDALTGL
jgi:two-component system, NarL family, invasion response regulator UvrY